jgi:hypothetical protein
MSEQKKALTECEAAFKKSNDAGEHPAHAEAFRAFRAGWYARADIGQSSESTAGMVLVPRELTAENGMKFSLSGDFSIRPDPESDVEYIVPWDTIKQIHRRVVELSNPVGGERRGQSPAPVLPNESSAGAQAGVTAGRDPLSTVQSATSATSEGYPGIAHDFETMRLALKRIVEASDQFVKDTGLKHGDLITDAVEAARPLIRSSDSEGVKK